MSGIAQAIQPAINSSEEYGAAAAGAATTGESEANSAYQQGVNESEASLSPFVSGGTAAYDAYLAALGISVPASSASSSTATVENSLNPTGQYITNATPGFSGWTQGQINAAGYNTGIAVPDTAGTLLSNGQPLSAGSVLTVNGQKVTLSASDVAALQSGKSFTVPGINGQLNDSDLGITVATGSPTPSAASSVGAPTTSSTSSSSSTPSILQTLQNTPGYQFMLTQGLSGVQQAAAAQGLLGSGAQGQALTQYAENYANNYYNNYLSQLSTATGIGSTASGQLASDVTSGSNTQQSASTTAGGQASTADTATQKQVGTLQAGNLSVPGLNTNLLGIGTSNL